jgi:hypothetical protein
LALTDRFTTVLLGCEIDKPQLLRYSGTSNAVVRHVSVPLKVEQARERIRPKDTVHLPGLKPQRVEPRLKLSDIVSTHHWDSVIEHPVS